MAENRRTDCLGVGESPQPLTFTVTPEFNQQYLDAVQDNNPRYRFNSATHRALVHPALLINYSNITRSPSFFIPANVAAVHTHEEIAFVNPGNVGDTFTVTWKIIDVYEKRGRKYQVKEAKVVNQDNALILKRKITDTYVVGKD